MGILLALALFVLPAQQAAAPPATGTLQGKVIRGSTQEPLAGVQVTLTGGPNAKPPQFTPDANGTVRIDLGDGRIIMTSSIETANNLIANPPPGIDFGGLGAQAGTLTDAAGSYSFKGLAPGRYTVRVQREGYFGPVTNGNSTPFATKSADVAEGKAVTEDFALVKGGVITGKIRNPTGQPQQGNYVVAAARGYSSGRPIFLTSKAATSDDQGGYRLFYLPPGEYFVGVSPLPPATTEREQDTWTNVFYPGTTDISQIVPLRLDEGQELGNIDMTLQKASAPGYKITGKIVNIPPPSPLPPGAAAPAGINLPTRIVSSFMPRELGPLDNPPATQSTTLTATDVSASGEFTIRNVRPGLYDFFVFTQQTTPNRVNWISSTAIDITNADVSGVNLALTAGVPLTGNIVDNENVLGERKNSLRIALQAAGLTPPSMVSRIGAVTIDESGKLSAPSVPQAHYTVAISGLPPNAYIADIKYGTMSVFDSGIDVGGQQQPFDVVIAAGGATIQGTVVSKTRPMSDATVVLVPQESRRQNAALYKNVVTNDNGKFAIRGVAPGTYTIFAWQNVVTGAWQNAEFLEKYRTQGKAVTAVRQGTVDLELEMIP